jgi:hypothetical protein
MVITLQVTAVCSIVYFLCRNYDYLSSRNYDYLSSRNPRLPARKERISFTVWRIKIGVQKSRYVIDVWTLLCAITAKKHRSWLLPAKDI